MHRTRTGRGQPTENIWPASYPISTNDGSSRPGRTGGGCGRRTHHLPSRRVPGHFAAGGERDDDWRVQMAAPPAHAGTGTAGAARGPSHGPRPGARRRGRVRRDVRGRIRRRAQGT